MAKLKAKLKRAKTVIGWKEWCALPDLGLPAVRAKIDTGARTSALHAYDIEIVKKKNKYFVRFKVHPLAKSNKLVRTCEAPYVGNRIVISSNGKRQLRPVILTTIHMDGATFETELTLTSRHEMNFRMLLGRKALRAGRFVINPAKSFLLGKIKKPESLYKK